MASESKKQAVLQLLRDYRAFHSPRGGAAPLDETGVVDASYGPGGITFTGSGFEPEDRRRLEESYRALNAALRLLRRDHMDLWVSLVEPYLADPADPGAPEEWRRRLAELDEKNAAIRKRNDLVRRGKRPGPIETEETALVFTRLQLERHDQAIEKLSRYLEDVDLHYVGAKIMSESEEAAHDRRNANVFAHVQRLRVAGLSERAAIAEAARNFKLSPGEVETIVEFRKDVKLASCIEEGCGGEVYQQNMCQKHYQRAYRARKKDKVS